MIEITDRWGLAKKGNLDFKQKNITIPNIFFLDDEYFSSPDGAEIKISQEQKGFLKTSSSFFDSEHQDNDLPSTFAYPQGIADGLVKEKEGNTPIQVLYDQDPDPEAEIYVIGNAPQLLKRTDRLYEKIISVRKSIDYHKLIYLPGIAQPNNLALFTYLGVDLFDSAYIELMSYEDSELSNFIGFEGDPNKSNQHLLEELRLVRKSIEHGKIRELVESRIRSEPWMVEMLRKMDEDYEFISKGVPVTGDEIYVTTREGLNRPDIKRFRKRMKKRYRPPERDVLLLLPCSARKPYFQSRSHRRFREATREVCWTDLHEVILTSPIGAVPRELELFYPAQQYDIPVSHEWFEEERRMILDQLHHLIEKGDHDHIISHLPSDMSFVHDEIDCVVNCAEEHPTSSTAIGNLRKSLQEVLNDGTKDVQNFLQENIASFCRFQFGRGGENLLKDAHIEGKYPWYKIISENTQRGMLVPQRGLISLTLEGAEILKEEGINIVEIDDFKPKGSVFAVGIKQADQDIRPKEEAIVVHQGELRGVGPAMMSGEEMIEAERGEAVKLRHYP